MPRALPLSVLCLSLVALLVLPGLGSAIPFEDDPMVWYSQEYEPGTHFVCWPTLTNGSLGEATDLAAVSWAASFNLTSLEYEYRFHGGTGENNTLEYAQGFAMRNTEYGIVTPDLIDMPYPTNYTIEAGLSLHGNPCPVSCSVRWMFLLSSEMPSWVARYNETTYGFEYYFPPSNTGVNFTLAKYEGAFMYLPGNESITVEYTDAPPQWGGDYYEIL